MDAVRGRLDHRLLVHEQFFGATTYSLQFGVRRLRDINRAHVFQEPQQPNSEKDRECFRCPSLMFGRQAAALTSRSSERPISRAVLLSQLSAGVAQLIVSRMSAPRILVLLLLCVTTAVAASDKTTLRNMWALPHYSTNSIPTAWLPVKIPATASDVSAFEGFSLRTEGLSIQKFIARYGLPSRYLTTKRDGEHDFLIYDLPSGHAVALYAPKPPADSFSACVIITSDGSLVRLIK